MLRYVPDNPTPSTLIASHLTRVDILTNSL